jgi:hypothetical protein
MLMLGPTIHLALEPVDGRKGIGRSRFCPGWAMVSLSTCVGWNAVPLLTYRRVRVS